MQLVLFAERFADRDVGYSVGASVKDSGYLLGKYFNSGKVQVGGELEVVVMYLVHLQEIGRRINLVYRLDEYEL